MLFGDRCAVGQGQKQGRITNILAAAPGQLFLIVECMGSRGVTLGSGGQSPAWSGGRGWHHYFSGHVDLGWHGFTLTPEGTLSQVCFVGAAPLGVEEAESSVVLHKVWQDPPGESRWPADSGVHSQTCS